MTKKKLYEKPTIEVVPVNIQSHILAGSNGDSNVTFEQMGEEEDL